MDSKVLTAIASKIGVNSESTIKKSEELIRLIEVNSRLSSLALSANSISVICLHIAANITNQEIDKVSAIRLSGLPKRNYFSTLKITETVLNIKNDVSISNLAFQLNCVECQCFAQQLFDCYISSQVSSEEFDFSNSLFILASLYVASKKKNVKLDKSKLFSCLSVQKKLFDKLVTNLEKLADKIIADEVKKSQMDKLAGVSDANDQTINNIQSLSEGSLHKQVEKVKSPMQILTSTCSDEEDYHTWKTRILAQARLKLNLKDIN